MEKHNFKLLLTAIKTSLIIALSALIYELITDKLEKKYYKYNETNIFVIKHILHFIIVFIIYMIIIVIFLKLFHFNKFL